MYLASAGSKVRVVCLTVRAIQKPWFDEVLFGQNDRRVSRWPRRQLSGTA
jgi:hypothetical protein